MVALIPNEKIIPPAPPSSHSTFFCMFEVSLRLNHLGYTWGGTVLLSDLLFMCKCLIVNQKYSWIVKKISLFGCNYKVENFQRN